MPTTRPVRRAVAAAVVGLLAAGCAGSAPGEPAAGAAASASSSPSSSPSPSGVAPLPLLGPLPTAALDAATAGRLDEVLDRALTPGVPDVVAAVVTADGTWTGAAGVDDPGGRPATPRDSFALASITKLFTATLVLRLAEQGSIDLDAPLAYYLGDRGAVANGATVRQALGMRAGLPETSDETRLDVYARPAHRWTAAEVLARIDAPLGPPGERYFYSNPTYKLLAMAVEHVTGTSYGAALRAELLDPVGVVGLHDQADGTRTRRPWALPVGVHHGELPLPAYGVGRALPNLADATFSYGASSMAGDAASLATWAWHLFAGDVVSRESLAAMTDLDDSGIGLGLEREPGYEPSPALSASGHKPGYASTVVVLPADGVVVVVAVNDVDGPLETIVRNLRQALG